MKPRLSALLLLAALGPAGCGRSQPGRATSAGGWIAHKGAGYTLETPRGWTVRAEPKTGRLDIQGAAREQVLVWPVFIRGALDPASAPAALHKLAGGLWADARWEAPQPLGATAMRARGRTGDRLALAALAWVPSSKGAAACLYVVAAPEAGFRLQEETFARILSGVRLTGAPAAGGQSSMNWVRWQDPREKAFSFEIPSGWNMTGGLFRFASVDTRPAWQLTSPDGQIRITGGDAELPPFTLPNQTLAMAGFREGSWYSPGYGVNMMVRRYLPGVVFAKEYVSGKAARGCAELAFTDSRERPDAAQAINAVYSQYGGYGVSVSLTAGEAAFTCRQNGQPMRGYYFAGTQLTHTSGMGLWNVEHLCGYLAPAAQADLAQSVLNHIIGSIEINPQWAAMQQGIAANTSRIVARTSEEISKIVNDTYWNRQGVMDELSRRRSNATLGVEDVIDPASGRQIKLESGSDYYWIDQRGSIVGTQTDTRPNLDFRALIRLP
jgi:hypothetical protein